MELTVQVRQNPTCMKQKLAKTTADEVMERSSGRVPGKREGGMCESATPRADHDTLKHEIEYQLELQHGKPCSEIR